MGKKKVVLDTNILISALGWQGKPRILFDEILSGKYRLVISKAQIKELLRVMDYPKFKFSEKQKTSFLTILTEISEIIETKGTINLIQEDLDDNIILETAKLSNANYIISGDEHLLKLKRYHKTKITPVSEFLS
ncbi:hypothetical protein AYK26_01470 [Euryarchaeota archaeon SM23-78]|nr:MAG: hypothetical protein AYK26_01470 [Euryarchaeota archaeon SM23-78]MBW3000464.1 putative toxin-antitoxin system toxin component, PIN family [Candidatus Woesearchaeota archaeon]